MLSFCVFDDFGPASDFSVRHAAVIGKDGQPIPAEIAFESGVITCTKSTPEAVALQLQFDASEAGRLTLQTTLLPERERPYLLPLELARHRIMLFLNKLEDWGLTPSLVGDDPILADFDRARELFTEALTAPAAPFGHYAPEQAASARAALALAINASEALALRQATLQLKARFSAGIDLDADLPDEPDPNDSGQFDFDDDTPRPKATPQSRPQLGCTLHAARFAPPLKKIAHELFDFVTVPALWSEIEPDEGKYDFRATDQWIEWAVRTGKKPVVAGPILDLTSPAMPKWLNVWQHDYDTMREFAFEHVTRVVTRYRKAISRWTAISAPPLGSTVSFSLDQWIDLSRLAVLAIRKGNPSARVTIEIPCPYPEALADPRGVRTPGIGPKFFAEMLAHAGVRVDAYALRIQMGDALPGRSTRDLCAISSIIDDFAALEKPIHISALGAPSQPIDGDPDMDAGYWRQAWSPEQQAQWYRYAVHIAMSKPSVATVCIQGLYDLPDAPAMAHGTLITERGRSKPALSSLASVCRSMHEPIPPSSLFDVKLPALTAQPNG